jgi:hypothetical protein
MRRGLSSVCNMTGFTTLFLDWFGEHYYYYYYYYYYLTSFATHDGKVKPQSYTHTYTHRYRRTCWNSPWPTILLPQLPRPGPAHLNTVSQPFFSFSLSGRWGRMFGSSQNTTVVWESQRPRLPTFDCCKINQAFVLAILLGLLKLQSTQQNPQKAKRKKEFFFKKILKIKQTDNLYNIWGFF